MHPMFSRFSWWLDINFFFFLQNRNRLLEDSLKSYDDCLYLISISTFLAELHQNVVFKVLLVFWFEILANKPVDKYQGKIYWKKYDDLFINGGDIN